MKASCEQSFGCAVLTIFLCLAGNVVAQDAPSVIEEPIVDTTEFLLPQSNTIFDSSEIVTELDNEEQVFENEIIVGEPVFVLDEIQPKPCAQEQRVSVKKSVLGCNEEISILPKDEVWMINARDCVQGEADLSMLSVTQVVDSDMVEKDLSQLTAAHSSGDDLATVLYVHGNMTDKEFAFARGLQVYRNAFAKKADQRVGVRFVIWAWKSEQEKTRLYPDFKIKSDRSVLVGENFAATLNQFGDRNVIVIGFSLGVQVVLSGLDSASLDPRPNDPFRYEVAMVAPAINARFVADHSLQAGWDSPVQQTFVITNRKDRSIQVAQAIIRRKNPTREATIPGLSDAGMLNVGLVTPVDISDEAGRCHSIERYTRSDTLQTIMANLANTVSAKKAVAPVVVCE